jgi:hypothetical protein
MCLAEDNIGPFGYLYGYCFYFHIQSPLNGVSGFSPCVSRFLAAKAMI